MVACAQLLLACVRAFTSISPYPSYPTAVARALYIVQASPAQGSRCLAYWRMVQ